MVPRFSFTSILKRKVLIALVFFTAVVVTLTLLVVVLVQITTLSVGGLQTNRTETPLGISPADATFSWRSEASYRGATQSAYELRVAESKDSLGHGDIWSSGRVESSEQLNVNYAGLELAPEHRYFWQVRIWDSVGNKSAWSDTAWFETALSAESGWNADWIGGEDPATEMARWSDYTVSVDFSLDSLAMGVYLRAKDVNNGYMWQVTVADGTPRFRAHVKEYSNFSVVRDIDISHVVPLSDLHTAKHNLTVVAKGHNFVTRLDGIEIDNLTDDSFGAGYAGFRQAVLEHGPEIAAVSRVVVTAADGTTLLSSDFTKNPNPFTEGTLSGGLLELTAPLDVLYNPKPSLPILRKEFSAKTDIASARLYASARGVYQININGQDVGDSRLAPGWTDYAKRLDYQTYDVTNLIQSGGNVVSAMLGDGWYSGHIGGFGSANYGTRPSLLTQLRIDFDDGSHVLVGSDSSWQYVSGPLLQADLIMGETFDQRRMPQDWERPGFSDPALRAAHVVDGPKDIALEPQSGPATKVVEVLTPVGRVEPSQGRWIYDMGQNMVGVVAATLRGAPGQTVQIRYGEMLNKDGTLYTANLRSAKATDRYTFDSDGIVRYTPKFTFHGFRYAEISGVDEPPDLDEVTGEVLGSDLDVTGQFSTSSDMLNKLQRNIWWSQRGNFLSVPMDTPARDERLAWTGDINVFAQTAAFNADTGTFLEKWLRDLRDSQLPSGDFPGIAPSLCSCFQGGAGWSDASITVPYSLWRAYGSHDAIRDNYAMMKKFMDFRIASMGANGVVSHGPYGDWLNLDDPTNAGLIGTAYLAYTARLLSSMASAIGETEDAAAYAQTAALAKGNFANAFVRADGSLVFESQAAYAIAIGMELVPDDLLAAAGNRLLSLIEMREGHLSTGFLGTPWLLPALSSTGHLDVALQMLNATSYPSWGYEVAQGATTMWERWDGVKPNGDLGDPRLNSYNHYAYGAVGDWMYRNVAGIAPSLPGYKAFVVAPIIGGGLTHAGGSLESVYGRISSNWRLKDTGLELEVSVPVNTQATVHIPADGARAVSEGGRKLSEAKGIASVVEESGTVVVVLGSGDYRFEVK